MNNYKNNLKKLKTDLAQSLIDNNNLIHENKQITLKYSHNKNELLNYKDKCQELENKIISLSSMVNVNLELKSQLVENKKLANE